VATLFVAQVMTRGMVKNKLIYVNIMGNPQPSTLKVCSSSTKCRLAY